MAFQDNSDDIIIDAVLTDVGRKYMAQGKFKISKFALGDDEINYGFATVSGKGDEGKSIPAALKQPLLEAFSNESANINYGLLSFPGDDILYIPKIKVNELVNESATGHRIPGAGTFYYIAANQETARKVTTDLIGRAGDHLPQMRVLQNNQYDKNKIVIESGITIPPKTRGPAAGEFASDLKPTEQNKKAYILRKGLYDKYFMVYTDGRFVDKILTSPSDSIFENDNDNNLYMSLGPLQDRIQTSLPPISDFYESYRVEAADHKIISTPANVKGNNHTTFTGPRATIFAMNLKLNNLLIGDSNTTADFRYSKFGFTNQPVFGGSNRYDFINSTIYVQGLASNSRLIIPIRIIRFSGTS